MKQFHHVKKIVTILLTLTLGLAAFSGCSPSSDNNRTGKADTIKRTTIADESSEGKQLRLLKQLKFTYGEEESYHYDYDYNFGQKELTVTAKNVPAGDEFPQDCFTWYLTSGILTGQTVEAMPNLYGAKEELSLWAQPLLATGRILNYKLVLYFEDATEPNVTISYQFTTNKDGLPDTCRIKYTYPPELNSDTTAEVYYQYDKNGYLTQVSNRSENRNYEYKFQRNKRNALTKLTLQETLNDGERSESWDSTSEYFYDKSGKLIRIDTTGQTANPDSVPVNPDESSEDAFTSVDYRFSDQNGKLTGLHDKDSNLTFTYDAAGNQVNSIQWTDNAHGSVYYTMDFTYETITL